MPTTRKPSKPGTFHVSDGTKPPETRQSRSRRVREQAKRENARIFNFEMVCRASAQLAEAHRKLERIGALQAAGRIDRDGSALKAINHAKRLEGEALKVLGPIQERAAHV